MTISSMKKTTPITADELRRLLKYDPETGIFKRRVRMGPFLAGSKAGCLHYRGYIHITIDGQEYTARHLAWLYMTGEWPKDKIDHRDLNRANNRFNNLREATHAENCQNRKTPSSNTSGFKGVFWNARYQKWQGQVKHNKRSYNLGYFSDKLLAAEAVRKKREELHGPFARA